MVTMTSLWLPILLSAVGVFIVSSIVHMILPYHRTDYGKLPNEEAVMDALRPHGIAPGEYAFPHSASPEDMKDPGYAEKMNRGPVGILTVWPNGPFNMGKTLTGWFVYLLVVSIFVAYLVHVTVEPGADYLRVFRIAGTGAFMAYVLGLWPGVIWFGKSSTTALKSTFDGLLYALVTAGFFGWLFPGT